MAVYSTYITSLGRDWPDNIQMCNMNWTLHVTFERVSFFLFSSTFRIAFLLILTTNTITVNTFIVTTG